MYGLGAAFRKIVEGAWELNDTCPVPRVPFPTGLLTKPEFGPKEPPYSSPKNIFLLHANARGARPLSEENKLIVREARPKIVRYYLDARHEFTFLKENS